MPAAARQVAPALPATKLINQTKRNEMSVLVNRCYKNSNLHIVPPLTDGTHVSTVHGLLSLLREYKIVKKNIDRVETEQKSNQSVLTVHGQESRAPTHVPVIKID